MFDARIVDSYVWKSFVKKMLELERSPSVRAQMAELARDAASARDSTLSAMMRSLDGCPRAIACEKSGGLVDRAVTLIETTFDGPESTFLCALLHVGHADFMARALGDVPSDQSLSQSTDRSTNTTTEAAR